MFRFLKIIFLMCGISLVGCSTIQTPELSTFNASTTNDPIDSWSQVLQDYVNDRGQIDFIGLSKKPEQLNHYVHYVSIIDPETDLELFPNANTKMAHHINAYNAVAMYGVIKLGIPRTNAGLKKVNFFYLKRYKIAGEIQSLYAYEEKIRELGDPRVHFILNCMSIGCPILPRTPIQAEGLGDTLHQATIDFFADPSKIRIDHDNKTVYFSEILKFYRDEFLTQADSLISYANQYVSKDIPLDYKVKFIPYDWTINQTSP